ncbi:MAG: hypothetical protein JWO32_1181 [Bacteroidetes bacterium]|nr:hypothetical protein [Bacteroidota bacterium]
MTPNFNIDRPKVSDEEIHKHKNFDELVKQFKQQSIQKAKLDNSWWKNKKVRYSSVIAGTVVICTITYLALFNSNQKQNTNDKIITQSNPAPAPHKKFISPPSNKLSIPYSTYTISNTKGGEIKHSTASTIKIPKKSFVDKNGKDVIGDVTIEYREFQDKGDIIASGIPMNYDSSGIKLNLESAGMFDIQGSQNGEAVFIKPGSNLEVELASANNENRFNQYYLDTIQKNWTYLKKDQLLNPKEIMAITSEVRHSGMDGKENQKKLELLKNVVTVIIPKRLDSVKIVYTNKVSSLPKAKEPLKPSQPTGKPTFYIDGSQEEFPELAAFDKVIFEVGDENKNYTKSMHDVTWSDVKVSEGPLKGKNYLLTLTYRSRVEKLIVYPVLSGADFEKAHKKYEQKFLEYKSLAEKRTADEKKIMAEMEAKQKIYLAEIDKNNRAIEALSRQRDLNTLNNSFSGMNNATRAMRVFSISKFGIYNSDCPHTLPEGIIMSPQFSLNENGKIILPDLVYLVDHTGNLVFNYASAQISNIRYNPASINSFVVFIKNKMYLCDKNSFTRGLSKNSKFSVTELPESADNLPDFKKTLEI